MEHQILTTGEIAKFCGVNYRTVNRWIKRGDLKGYHLPGRGDSRVNLEDFLDFLKKNNMPIPKVLQKRSHRVLIVEDDEIMALSLERVLNRSGFEVAIAKDGIQAGVLLESFSPSVVTLDLMIPGISGLEVLKFIKKNPSTQNIKILVLSGLSKDELEEARLAGADETLEKPCDTSIYIEKVAALAGINLAENKYNERGVGK